MNMSNVTDSINEIVDRIKAYVESLTEKEKIGWLMILGGFVLVILSLILW